NRVLRARPLRDAHGYTQVSGCRLPSASHTSIRQHALTAGECERGTPSRVAARTNTLLVRTGRSCATLVSGDAPRNLPPGNDDAREHPGEGRGADGRGREPVALRPLLRPVRSRRDIVWGKDIRVELGQ